MEDNKNPKIIKVQPWRGFDDEIHSGKKTKITLLENRLEYKIEFTQTVKIKFIKEEDDDADYCEKDNFCNENGVINKDSIIAFVEFIETQYNPNTTEPTKVHMVDISYGGGNVLSLSMETEAEQHNLFNEIYNWKFKE